MLAVLSGHHVIKVACGSGDAHSLCVTVQGNVYSWGDGDYGKLGNLNCKMCIVAFDLFTKIISS